MSDEKIYRQERKINKVTMSEIINGNSENEGEMIQNQIPNNMPKEPLNTENLIRPKEGVQIVGKLPPGLQEALKRRITEVENESEITSNVEDFTNTRQQSYSNTPVDYNSIQQLSNMQQKTVATQQLNRNLQQSPLVTNDPNLNVLLGALTTQNYERVILPSMGKFYTDADQPSGGEVHIRPMTGQEESILSTARFMRDGRGIEMIFKNCIQELHINPSKLLNIDRTYLLIYLRAISYGHLYEVTMKCPSCGHSFDYDIDLNLPVKYCPDDFGISDLTKTLPHSGLIFTYRMQTGADEDDIETYQERKSKFNNTTNDSFLYKASVLIKEIGNNQAKVTNKYAIQSLLERLVALDTNYIRNILNDPPFGVDTLVPIDCPNCGHDFKQELPYGANFFFPQVTAETGRQ